ncbi:MAG: DUF6702 family protein [Acidobacteriota bacterium]|nr:DUF6702 family protein [Acidobacteriota bacterium]
MLNSLRRKRWAFLTVFRLGVVLLCLPIQHSAFSLPTSHKVHVSVSQLEYNQKAQSVEIVLRVYADDFENALSQHAKRQVKLDPATINKDKRIAETVMAYLRESFQLKDKAGRSVRLNWVGMEWQVDMFWLYVEGKMTATPPNSNALAGAQLKNKVFNELFDDQVNIVNAKIQNKQFGLMFESKDGFKTIAEHVMSKGK